MKQNLLPENIDLEKSAPLWVVHSDRKSIERQFTFKDFQQAFEFMTLSAQYAEEINHHPDWSNSWNRVRVILTTHSSGGLTELDMKMAQKMNQFADTLQSKT
jgi:4a-hydroxytetrahydrobiopterin dehydratase